MVCVPPWPQASEPPSLQPGEVHLWSASLLTSQDRLPDLERYLDERERARVNRYALQHSRVRFVSARATLKHLLAAYTGYDPFAMRFHLGSLGKPYLPQMSGLVPYFNSTDTQDEAIFAFCQDAEIGVDIEFKTRQVNHPIIAQRKFTSQELAQYHACPAEQRQSFFLSVWTRKEAYGKAIGVGIKYPLNQVCLVDDDNSSRIAFRDVAGVQWDIVQIEPADNLVACVVTQGTGWRFRCQRLAADWL